MKIDPKLIAKINELEDDNWEIEKIESDERCIRNDDYRVEVIVRLLEKPKKKSLVEDYGVPAISCVT